jgi:hypothetical protein
MTGTYRGIPEPDLDWAFMDRTTAWRTGADAVLEAVLPLLDARTDDDPCVLDHLGYCQTHFAQYEGRCWTVVVREFVDRATHPSVWFAHGEDGLLHWCFEHKPAGLHTSPRPLSDFHPASTVRCVQCGRSLCP